MSDGVQNAGGAPADDPQAAAGVQGAAEGAATDSGAQGAQNGASGDAGALDALRSNEGATAAPADWPEDWRERLTDGDEASMTLAKRFRSPQAVWQKLLAQEQVIRRGAHKTDPELPENATPEQITEYRKTLGVPETPDGYELAFDKALPAGDEQKAILSDVVKFAHENNVPAKYAQAMFKGWQQAEARLLQQRQDDAQRQFQATKAELRREDGHEYERNIGVLENWLDQNPGFNRLVRSNLHDKALMRDAINTALALADPGALIASSSSMAGKTPEERMNELSRKSISGTLTKAEDKEYNDLIAFDLKRQDSRNRAA